MDLWSLYGRYRENGGGDENGFRTDEAENQGIAVDACRKGQGWPPLTQWCMIQAFHGFLRWMKEVLVWFGLYRFYMLDLTRSCAQQNSMDSFMWPPIPL